MTIHYSKFKLNTYAVTPYFDAHVPEDYPLDRVLISSRTHRNLPPNLKKLSALAKRWALRKYTWHPAGMYDIENYYDDEGRELNPATRECLTDEEIEEEWNRVLSSPEGEERFEPEDIPVPAGGFADPDTWEEPAPEVVSGVDPDAPNEDAIVRDIKSHGREYVAKDYGVPAEWLPRVRNDRHLARTIVRMRGKHRVDPSALSIDDDNPPDSGDTYSASKKLQTPKEVGVLRDWDRLRSVIVGRSDNDVIPEWYPSFEPGEGNEVDDPDAVGKTKKEYDGRMHRRAVRQTESLCKVLEEEGIQVIRPDLLPPDVAQDYPVGLSQAWAREVVAVFSGPNGGTIPKIVVGQMRTPHRNKDVRALEPLLSAIEQAGMATVHHLPPCSFEKNTDWEHDERPFLEGGDVFRLGADVVVTMSYLATSPAGCAWLRDLLAPDGIEVWPSYLTKDWEHGDYVFMPVREGLCVAYLRGFVDGLLPTPITDWDVVAITRDEADQRFAANGLVLRPNVVLLPEGNRRLVRALERKGVDVIEVPFDGPQHWQGGIRCSTTELWRGDGRSVSLSTDVEGHEHKGRGPGGGQFVSTGTGDTTGDATTPPTKPDFNKAPATRGRMMEAIRVGSKKTKDEAITLRNGQPAPSHIKPSMVAPDWTDVLVSLDPNSELLVKAIDNKGRPKSVYSDAHDLRTEAIKFARVDEMIRQGPQIDKEIQAARVNPKTREQADCCWLMSAQATRPGSKSDTGAKVKAYGATTLEGRHVLQDASGQVRLYFVGKEGVQHNHVIHNPELAKMLLTRKKAAGDTGTLFKTSETAVNNFIGKLDGGHFSAKDFRTRRANLLAARMVARFKGPPKDEKEYKARVKAVAYSVSTVLGNKPQQCLESYINPAVFSVWKGIS